MLTLQMQHLHTLLNFAIQNQKNKKFKIAEETYKKILKLNPTNIIALYNMGILSSQFNKIDEAIIFYKKVININPKLEDVHNNLGLLYYQTGDEKRATDCYEKAININPNYSNAHNNLGVVNAGKGKYEIAINYYLLSLSFNPNHKETLRNLLIALCYFNSTKNNQIINAHNSLKKFRIKFKLEDFLENKNIKKLLKFSSSILSSLEQNKILLDNYETQIHRRNSINLNCERHHKVFGELKIIPSTCFSCFKIQIEPKSVLDLIKLFFIFNDFNFKNNNWRKCMVETRSNVTGTYKGLIYCSSLEEVNNILSEIQPILQKFLNYKFNIKRGCSEFYSIYNDFKELDNKNDNYMNYDKDWKKLEEDFDTSQGISNKKYTNSISGFSLLDFITINNWLNYAKIINDNSYKDVLTEFYHSNLVLSKIADQIEFRKKQLAG